MGKAYSFINAKMRILFSFTVPLDKNAGGVQRVTSILQEQLNKKGYQTSYLYCKNQYKEFVIDNKIYKSLSPIINHFDIIINQDGFDDKLTSILKNETWNGIYLVCIHNTPDMFQKFYSLKNMISGALFSTWSKVWYAKRLLIYPLWKRKIIRDEWKIQKFNYDNSDALVLLSDNFFNLLIHNIKLTSTDKLFAINNPLSYEYSSSSIPKTNNILIVSRISSEKRIDLAIKAWNKVKDKKDWSLTIMGEGPQKKKLMEYVKNKNIPNINFIDKQNPLNYYRKSKIFLMTSEFEGWGMTLTEAQQNGCVPIAMKSYLSVTDIISNGNNGLLIKDGSIKELTHAIEILINDEQKLKELSHNAFKSAKRYEASQIADKWILLIETLYKRKSSIN